MSGGGALVVDCEAPATPERNHHSQPPHPQQEREYDNDSDGAPENTPPSLPRPVNTLRGGRRGGAHGPLRGGLHLDHDRILSWR